MGCFFVIYVSPSSLVYCLVLLVFLCMRFPCVFFHFPIWCHGSRMVLDCIESQSLPSSLLLTVENITEPNEMHDISTHCLYPNVVTLGIT